MTQYSFDATGPVRVRAKIRSSDLVVTATDTTEVAVTLEPHKDNSTSRTYAEDSTVHLRDDVLTIEVPRSVGLFLGSTPRLRIHLEVPTGSALDISSGSGDVQADGQVGEVHVRTGSGDLRLQDAGAVTVDSGSGSVLVRTLTDGDFNTGSGNVRLGRSSGRVRAKSGSGDLTIDDAADVVSTGASGNTTIGQFAGSAHLRSASGDVSIHEAIQGEINAVSASGDVTVGIRPGTAVLLDCASTSGRTDSTLSATDAPASEEDTLELRARAVSGDIRISHTR